MRRLLFVMSALFLLTGGQAFAGVSDEEILKTVLDFHNDISGKIEDWRCWYENRDLEGTSVTRLKDAEGEPVFIVPVLCFAHQSNATTVFYRVTAEDSLVVTPLTFPLSGDGETFLADVPAPNGEITSDGNGAVIHARMAGSGFMRDACGTDLTYVWDGYDFVLSEIRHQPCCEEKGAGKWCDPDSDAEPPDEKPLVFSHKVKPWK